MFRNSGHRCTRSLSLLSVACLVLTFYFVLEQVPTLEFFLDELGATKAQVRFIPSCRIN